MYKNITFLFILSSLLLSSCNKWLDVKPQAQTTEDLLFKSQKGFKDALIGSYIRLKSDNIYGGSLTWGNIEFMALNWDLPTNNTNNALVSLRNGQYRDATVKEWMDNIFKEEYKVIADVNGLLEQIDAKKSVFEAGNYELIKGEALGLRAMAHFDVLRLFGPLPEAPGSLPLFPYVKSITKNIHDPLTYLDFTKTMLADLTEAENLLKGVDPIVQYSMEELKNLSNPILIKNSFLAFRQTRMNYYAVVALKARVYLWLAATDPTYKTEALNYAKMVINAVSSKGEPTFVLGRETQRLAQDYTMSPEHIFAIDMYDLADKANGNFLENGRLTRRDFKLNGSFYYLNFLFPANERTADIRFVDMWEFKTKPENADFIINKKFIQRSANPINKIPLIRLSEMYLIAAEAAETKQEAESYYTKFCESKGIPFSSGFATNDWELDRKNKLLREYVREFYAEGKTFFNYKRLNIKNLPTSWTYSYYQGSPEKYIVPIPDREINYNNK